MNNLESPINNENFFFDEALNRSIDEMKKSEGAREQILFGKKLGLAFYRGVVEILEHELGEDFNKNSDFEETISPKIVKMIKERIGEDGFDIKDNIEKKLDKNNCSLNEILQVGQDNEGEEKWGIGRGLSKELSDKEQKEQGKKLKKMKEKNNGDNNGNKD
jgi:hypothetical protein